MSLGLSVNYHIACPQNRGSLQISAVQGKPLRSSSGVVAKKQQRFTGGGIGCTDTNSAPYSFAFSLSPFRKAGANSCSAFKNTSKDGSQAEAAVQGFFRL